MLLTHEELFVQTIADLRSKIRRNTTYSLIRGCGLCRQLLLDETPLVHLVNKKYRLPIRFHIKDHKDATISTTYKGGGGRTILPIGESKFVTLEEFLKTIILHSGQNEFSVKEIINTACHYYGGIHAFKPDIKQSSLIWLNRYYNTQTNTSFWLMGTICKVILQAMKPLEKKIKENITTSAV
ncbi:MAG: hypothetical protein ACTHJN_20420 [Ginsengibacter sp.]